MCGRDVNPICEFEGRGGLAAVRLRHPSGAEAEVYRNGAHVTSWTLPQGEEMLFLSRMSRWEEGRAIRGGIPLVFPQFGPGRLPQHGFARTSLWSLDEAGTARDGSVRALFSLEDTDSTRAIWPYRFSARMEVGLKEDSLSISLQIVNQDHEPFSFQIALHTYFRVDDISAVMLEGLRGVELVDSLRGGVRETEDREAITFECETDRIYENAPETLRLVDAARGRAVVISSYGMPDAVVWNPWVEKSRRMEDFGDDEYTRMLCVETGIVLQPVTLAPGAAWSGGSVFDAA
ncbi:MAG: D-hexose-6-phosphate mutarotase [Armatimonadota bacterium]|nr:MAG: D-hexose-6-phosphate mutarotase [Armatimonadota bacterium]